jgi:hypothetical protein
MHVLTKKPWLDDLDPTRLTEVVERQAMRDRVCQLPRRPLTTGLTVLLWSLRIYVVIALLAVGWAVVRYR